MNLINRLKIKESWTMLKEKWPRGRAVEIRNLIHSLNICSCGTNAQWECILEILAEAANRNNDKKGMCQNKWFEFGAKMLDSIQLLEHGFSIGNAWLSERGELLFEFLKDFGTDSNNFPDWITFFNWDINYKENDDYDIWMKNDYR